MLSMQLKLILDELSLSFDFAFCFQHSGLSIEFILHFICGVLLYCFIGGLHHVTEAREMNS